MKFSKFAGRFNEESGIVQLMQDLGDAMADDDEVMLLGGGNPAHIPHVQDMFKNRIQEILDNEAAFNRLIGNYDSPQGEKQFIEALVAFFNRNFNWGLTHHNVVLTNGSQTGFFMLLNAFAGECDEGKNRQILLPMVPEYIGYTDVGLTDEFFTAEKPEIEIHDDHLFKYAINFDHLKVDDNIGAICISRPTNPSGNVITDDEVDQLISLAETADVPLIIDNAYGAPFPDIIFTDVAIHWSERIIFSMSLSKLGLPSVRTGIIIAREDIAQLISYMNGVISLALGSLGPHLALDLVSTDRILDLCQNTIKSYYETKLRHALALLHKVLKGVNYYIHQPEGAIFIWLWLPDFPISSQELYLRLKQKGVLILSGHHFFPGLKKGSWQHQHECLRISYAMDDTHVINGINLIAREIKAAYD